MKRMIILSIITYCALAYMKVDNGMRLALSVLAFVVYWGHNWQDIKNDETTYYDEDATYTDSQSPIKETENDKAINPIYKSFKTKNYGK